MAKAVKKGAKKEKSPKITAAIGGKDRKIEKEGDYSDLFGAGQADGGFGAGQADDGRPAYEAEEKTDAGADESTIANVVSDPMEGKKGKGATGKKMKKGKEEAPHVETEVKVDGPEEEEDEGSGEEDAPEEGEEAGGQAGMEDSAKEVIVEPAIKQDEAIEKNPISTSARFVRVQANLSQVDSEKVLEAALFMASQPLAASDLAKLVGIAAIGHVDEKLSKLAAKYGGEASAIEIVKEEGGKWSMRVKAAYAPSVRTFAGEAEISRHALRTLAYISRSDGIKKRDLYKKLGSTIYEDAAELIGKGFITATPSGRTVSLKTTAKFRQYFQG